MRLWKDRTDIISGKRHTATPENGWDDVTIGRNPTCTAWKIHADLPHRSPEPPENDKTAGVVAIYGVWATKRQLDNQHVITNPLHTNSTLLRYVVDALLLPPGPNSKAGGVVTAPKNDPESDRKERSDAAEAKSTSGVHRRCGLKQGSKRPNPNPLTINHNTEHLVVGSRWTTALSSYAKSHVTHKTVGKIKALHFVRERPGESWRVDGVGAEGDVAGIVDEMDHPCEASQRCLDSAATFISTHLDVRKCSNERQELNHLEVVVRDGKAAGTYHQDGIAQTSAMIIPLQEGMVRTEVAHSQQKLS